MVGVGKHVNGQHAFEAIARAQHDRQLRGKCLGIAGDIDDPRRSQGLEDRLNHGGRATLARRIEHDEIGCASHAAQIVFGPRRDEGDLPIGQAIERGVGDAVPDGLPVVLDRDHRVSCPRQRKREEPAAGIEIQHVQEVAAWRG